MKTNGNDPINTVTMRQIGDDEYRLATEKDIREGIWLSARVGLTKREYFAASVIQGMLPATFSPCGLQGGDADGLADYAVRVSDALIEALNKEATHE